MLVGPVTWGDAFGYSPHFLYGGDAMDKIFMDYTQQINKLKEKGLTIPNTDEAIEYYALSEIDFILPILNPYVWSIT